MKFTAAVALFGLAAEQAAASAINSVEAAHCVCCSALAMSLPGKVIASDDSLYDARLKTYYSANAAQAPWCMVLPEGTEDVQKIAHIISELDCPFGMRGGAHSAWKGSNGIKDGVTIDFGYMNTTTYDKPNGLAKIQPGSNWGKVYNTLDPYGVTAVGGRADVVGVGGFTTGGGYSFHSSRRGFACDAVANFEIVLANGTVVNANANENADLFKAQKGGSGNLGFVTRVDTNIVDSNKLWGGITAYDLKERDNVFNAYIKFANNMAKDTSSQEIVAYSYARKTGLSLTSILTNSDGLAAQPAFDEFLAIKNLTTTQSTGTFGKQVHQFTGPTPLGLYANWFAGMTTNSFDAMAMISETLEKYIEIMKKAAPDADFDFILEFQPVPPIFVEQGNKAGGNILALDSIVADGPTNMWLIAMTIDTAESQVILLPLCRKLIDEVNAKANKMGVNKNWNYLNYSWRDQDPIKTYGPESVKYLKSIASKYDPTGVFQHLRSTGFKIPA